MQEKLDDYSKLDKLKIRSASSAKLGSLCLPREKNYKVAGHSSPFTYLTRNALVTILRKNPTPPFLINQFSEILFLNFCKTLSV
jgi:hypothetical protein